MVKAMKSIWTILNLMMVILCSSAYGEGYKVSEWIPLWTGEAPGESPASEKEVTVYPGHISRIPRPEIQIWEPKQASDSPRPALCIFPGGAYCVLSIENEGVEVAKWAADQGMVGIVVKYRVTDQPNERLGFPTPLLEARRAVRTVRHYAEKWNIDPTKIGVIGFSAGGHLAATAATIWNKPIPQETSDKVDAESARPDFAMLIYPVISIDRPYGHPLTKKQLLGESSQDETALLVTPYRQVEKETPPLFLAHAFDDRVVSCQNSLDMVQTAREQGVVTELHLVTKGGHGGGMAKRNTPMGSWPERAKEWLKSMGILPAST